MPLSRCCQSDAPAAPASHRAAFRLALLEALPVDARGTGGHPPGALRLLTAAHDRLAATIAEGPIPPGERAPLAAALREAFDALAAELPAPG